MERILINKEREVVLVVKLKIPGNYLASADSISKRAIEAVERHFNGNLKAEFLAFEQYEKDGIDKYTSLYEDLRERAEMNWPDWKIDFYNRDLLTVHGKPLSRKIGNREAAIIACHTGYFIDDETFEHALKYLSELKGSPVTEENFPQAKKEFREQTKTDFHNLGGTRV